MIIAIDFDGTIVQNDFPRIGKLLPGAAECIERLYNDGHYIIIWTCRCADDLSAAVNFLLENEIPFHRINDNNPVNTAKYNSNSRKVYAHTYIDDKNIGGFPGWEMVMQHVEIMEREYKENQSTKI